MLDCNSIFTLINIFNSNTPAVLGYLGLIKGIFRDNFLIFAVLFFAVSIIFLLSLGDTKKVANAHIVETPTVEGEVMVVEQILANIAVDKVNENLKGIKIKTKITKDGWGVTIRKLSLKIPFIKVIT
jgi:hypothetical protein